MENNSAFWWRTAFLLTLGWIFADEINAVLLFILTLFSK